MTIKLCPFCDQPFVFNLLKNHIATVHLGLESIPVKEPSIVESPVNVKLEPSDERVNIKEEPNTAKLGNIKHEASEDHLDQAFPCEQCGTIFDSINTLKVHEKVAY